MEPAYDLSATARPIEWVVPVFGTTEPGAIIRLFEKSARDPDAWYRSVTWAATSDSRRLIGWTRTLHAAVQVVIDYQTAERELRRGRGGAGELTPFELVQAYRAAARSENAGR